MEIDLENETISTHDDRRLEASIQELKHNYKKIETFFLEINEKMQSCQQLSIENILSEAPKYYVIIRFLEKFYIRVTNNQDWLKDYINKRRINFDWQRYKLWISGKNRQTRRYDDTQCPSKWITELNEQLLDLLKMLQLLLYMEAYTPDDDFRLFLRENAAIDYKYKANYLQKSLPSQDLDVFFKATEESSARTPMCSSGSWKATHAFDTNFKTKRILYNIQIGIFTTCRLEKTISYSA